MGIKSDAVDDDWKTAEIKPQERLRNSSLWKAGKPDARLVELVRILARQAAREDYEVECADKDKSQDDPPE